MFDAAYNGHFAAAGKGKNSLVAFLGAIRFPHERRRGKAMRAPERSFAQPHPQARQPQPANHEPDCIRSAN